MSKPTELVDRYLKWLSRTEKQPRIEDDMGLPRRLRRKKYKKIVRFRKDSHSD